MLILTLKNETTLPMNLGGLAPDRLAGKSVKEIERIPVWLGNRELPLADMFTIEGTRGENEITWAGDLHSAVGIGAGMKSGFVHVKGDAGSDVGLGMWGGEIEITGSALDNLGAEMRGGLIRVRGSVAINTGGALPGSRRGMTGGTILIDGNAGDFTGRRMRRGMIAVRGDSGNFLGHSMIAGTITSGNCGLYPGAEMSRGTICVTEGEVTKIAPTFNQACTAPTPVLPLIGIELQSLEFANDLWRASRRWQQFSGDMIVSGRGELFIASH